MGYPRAFGGWDALERKIRNLDLDALMVEYGEDTGIPLNAYERAQIRSVFKRVLRGLLEKKEVLYIRPAPGTCCPEMNIKKGMCLGCGTKKKKPEKT